MAWRLRGREPEHTWPEGCSPKTTGAQLTSETGDDNSAPPLLVNGLQLPLQPECASDGSPHLTRNAAGGGRPRNILQDDDCDWPEVELRTDERREAGISGEIWGFPNAATVTPVVIPIVLGFPTDAVVVIPAGLESPAVISRVMGVWPRRLHRDRDAARVMSEG